MQQKTFFLSYACTLYKCYLQYKLVTDTKYTFELVTVQSQFLLNKVKEEKAYIHLIYIVWTHLLQLCKKLQTVTFSKTGIFYLSLLLLM